MGTPWGKDVLWSGKKGIGIVVASQELSVRDEQADTMMCDPAISDPSNSACTDQGGKENCKERGNCGAPGDENAGFPLPASTSFSNGLFNDVVDGRFHSNFSDFVSFLQRYPAEKENNFQEYRNFSVAAVVNFLEGRDAEIGNAASQQIAELDAFYRSEVTMLTDRHEQQVIDSGSRSQGKIQELSRELEKVSKDLSDAQAQVISTRSSLNTALSETQDREKTLQVMHAQLEEETRQKQELSECQDSIQKDMNFERVASEIKLRHSQEAEQAKEKEVKRLSSVIEEKEKAVRNMEAVTSQLNVQLATIEQKFAQESLTSGSYADGHVNPSMLEVACKTIDKATDNMVRFLHDYSITSKSSLKTPELESFIGKISPAIPADFVVGFRLTRHNCCKSRLTSLTLCISLANLRAIQVSASYNQPNKFHYKNLAQRMTPSK